MNDYNRAPLLVNDCIEYESLLNFLRHFGKIKIRKRVLFKFTEHTNAKNTIGVITGLIILS